MATAKPSLVTGWAVQRRVVGALLMREVLTRYGRHNIGVLWLFVEPMLFTLGVTAFWNVTMSLHGTTLPITAFAVTGYSTVLLWRNMPTRCVQAIEPNLSLLYHRQVKVIDIYLARLILEAAGATASFMLLALVFSFFDMMTLPEDILLVLEGWLLLMWFGMALALFIGALSEQYELVEKLWHPTAYLSFPLSGAAFSLHALPKQAQEYLGYVPMVNATEMIREGYFGSKYIGVYDSNYLILFNLILTLFALAEVRKISRNVVPQ
jgi:ABC-2 type transport system permease protein/capsular polysaccharide transport system permease protein